MLKVFINVAKTRAGWFVLAVAAYIAILGVAWELTGWVLR